MGYEAYSYVVYGKLVDITSIKITKQKRNCNHIISLTNKFCPECGKPTYVDQETVLLDCMAAKGLSYYYSHSENKEEVILGFILGRDSYSNRDNSPFVEVKEPSPGMNEEIKDFCEAARIDFKSDDCKTWAFTYHSY